MNVSRILVSMVGSTLVQSIVIGNACILGRTSIFQIGTNHKRTERLRQSVLQCAFAGGLATTDITH